jgi:hypothetical protein
LLKQSTALVESKFEDFASLFGPGDVPGYLGKEDIIAISKICEMLPSNGKLVEVGSFLGKSAVEFSKNFTSMHKDYTIVCIDSFNSPVQILNQLLIDADFTVPSGVSTNLDMFTHYTQKYDNIFPVSGFFNEKFVFPEMVEAVFEDSTHTQEYLSYALPFWWDHIKPGGILSGHDYTDEVRTAVDIFAALNRLKVNTFENGSSIWYIKKK